MNDIGTGEPNLLEICILTDFLLDIIPIGSYTESTMNILPNLFKCIILSMKKNIFLLEHYEITISLELCTKILRKIQPVTVKQQHKPEVDVNIADNENANEDNQEEIFSDTDTNNKEIRSGLEKSKSDSKLNENMTRNELTIENTSRERSNSNQMLIKKKDKTSPKIDKKARSKKSKSSSKLYDIKRDELNEQSLSDTQEKVEIKDNQILHEITTTKTEIKHIIKCLETYKKFYSVFIQYKILKTLNIDAYYQTLINDKEERTKNLEKLLNKSLNPHTLASCSKTDLGNQLILKYTTELLSSSLFNKPMSIASNILLEFSTFPNILCEQSDESIPQWLKVTLVAACWINCPVDVRITAMNTLLELFSLAKSQDVPKKVEVKVNVVMMGILSKNHVDFIEESTAVLEVIQNKIRRFESAIFIYSFTDYV